MFPEILPPKGHGEKTADATDIKASMLEDGEMPSAEILERMSMHGVSERTVYKTKRLLCIESYKKGRTWYWKLQKNSEA